MTQRIRYALKKSIKRSRNPLSAQEVHQTLKISAKRSRSPTNAQGIR
ncbi:hypothetical protein NSQ43_12950 [Sporosarcina sp. FSL W8-0480]